MDKDKKYKDKAEEEIDADDKKTKDSETDESYDKKGKKTMKENLEKIFDGETLSEEFKETASVLFEAALNERVEVLREEITEELTEQFAKTIDDYSGYVVTEWIEENRVALEESQKVQFADKIIDAVRTIIEEAGVEVPSEKLDAHEALKEDYNKLKEKFNSLIEDKIGLENQMTLLKMQKVIDNVAEDLTVSAKEHFVSMIETVEYEDDAQYEKVLESVKSKFFSETKKEKLDETTQINEQQETQTKKSNVSGYGQYLL